MTNLLSQIEGPDQLKTLNDRQLEQLAEEIRELIIRTVSKNGGHLASNLGLVELTIALLIVFDFPQDRIVFDVGHQTYAWKILTGRCDQFHTLRKWGGLAGFPKTSESVYDFFNTGHSSTSISAALGLCRAMAYTGQQGRAIAVIGDGALTGGMAFEALNDAGQSKENLIVILNDNQMSISKNVGSLAKHLEKLRISAPYLKMRSRMERVLPRIPLIGKPILKLVNRVKRLTRMVIQRQSIFFEELGFRYYGPINGHDLPGLIQHLSAISNLEGPILLHVVTQKGRGYRYAEESPDLYHGVAPFVIDQGLGNGNGNGNHPAYQNNAVSFSEVMGSFLCALAEQDKLICAISAAMTSGTGLSDFARLYPDRFYDVGIAEQHAMTLAAGLAAGGMRPVVALYSTFLQRAFDQLLHDVCLQHLPVVIVIDRAGIVGGDGETHQGLYDLALLLPLPGIEIFCPADDTDLINVLTYAVQAENPIAIRYPKEVAWSGQLPKPHLDRYRVRCLRTGTQVTLAALGNMAKTAMEAADLLASEGLSAEVISVMCAKPCDIDGLVSSAAKTGRIILIEEALVKGGFGSFVLPDLLARIPNLKFRFMGVGDKPLLQGSRKQLLTYHRLDAASVAESARRLISS